MKLTEFSRIKWERARDLKKRGDYQEAERELKEALEEDPAQLLLKASLAELHLRQNRLMEARIVAEEILSFDPQYPQALYILGEISFKSNRFDQALQCFRQACQKDPRPYLVLRIAKTLRKMERYEEALDTLDSVLITDRQNPHFLKEKALLLGRMKRSDKALGIYEALHQLNPNDSFVRKEIYRLKGEKRPDQKVIRELETVVSLSSGKEDPQLHGLLGQKLKKAGKLKEAAAEFQIAYQLEPNNAFFLKQEGYCLYHLKEYDKAIQALAEAFRKDPTDYVVKRTLQRLYTMTEHLEEFASLLEEVLKDHPHHVKLLGTLKKVQRQLRTESKTT